MKPQDIVFGIAILFLIIKQRPKFSVWAGIVAIIASIPLFALWIFFTAERLTWYAAAFFLLAIIQYLLEVKKYEQ